MILITIGRNKDNRYVIEDFQKRISGYHAEIKVCDDNSISLIDHSLNGVTINGKKVDKEVEIQINRGADIIFGGFAKLDWNRIPLLPTIIPGTKMYSIGTHLTNRIMINDTSNMVSRYHATLKIDPKGKMTLNDHSSNGTFVNGSRISPNQDIPVKRKDKIMFANSQPFDWTKIPNTKSNSWYIFSPIAAILIVGLIFAFNHYYVHPLPKVEPIGPIVPVPPKPIPNPIPKPPSKQLVQDPTHGSIMQETEIYSKYGKAVVCVLHQYSIKVRFVNGEEGEITSGCTGTAFFIDNNGTLLTNRHITRPWEFLDQGIINKLKELTISHKSDIEQFSGNTNYIGFALKDVDINRDADFTECSILSQKTEDKTIDVGLLRTKNRQLPSIGINPIHISNAMINSKEVIPGGKVYVMGYPLGIDLFKATSSGTTNTIQVKLTCQSGTINQAPDGYKFGLNAQMTHGASGSPVFNDRGQLIGVFNSGINITQGLNFAILAKHAKELYDKAAQ